MVKQKTNFIPTVIVDSSWNRLIPDTENIRSVIIGKDLHFKLSLTYPLPVQGMERFDLVNRARIYLEFKDCEEEIRNARNRQDELDINFHGLSVS